MTFIVASQQCSVRALTPKQAIYIFFFTFHYCCRHDRPRLLFDVVVVGIFFALKSGRFTPSLLLSFASSWSWLYDSSLLFSVVAVYVSSYMSQNCMRLISGDTQ